MPGTAAQSHSLESDRAAVASPAIPTDKSLCLFILLISRGSGLGRPGSARTIANHPIVCKRAGSHHRCRWAGLSQDFLCLLLSLEGVLVAPSLIFHLVINNCGKELSQVSYKVLPTIELGHNGHIYLLLVVSILALLVAIGPLLLGG